VLLPAPGKKKRRGAGCGADTDTDTSTRVVTVAAAASAADLQPLETVAKLSRTKLGFTTADLGAEIMREMEEIERKAVEVGLTEGESIKR
jgi:hypothetical protein